MSTLTVQPIVIDGKGHLLGRLASIVAKQVGKRIIVGGGIDGWSIARLVRRGKRRWHDERRMFPVDESERRWDSEKSGQRQFGTPELNWTG